MNYQALSASLVLTDLSAQLDFAPPIVMDNNYYRHVPDDYDQSRDFGLMTGDLQRAFGHAFEIIRKVSRKRYSEDNKTFIANQLCTDLKNILSSIVFYKPPRDEDIKLIIQTIIYLGEYDKLIQIIQDYYISCREEEEENLINPLPQFALDYEDLFIKAGDYMLFILGNPSTAMKFYDIADYDWFHFRDNKNKDKLDNRARELDKWHKTYNILVEIDYCVVEKDDLSELIKDSDLINQFMSLQELIINPKHNSDEVIACTNTITSLIKQNTEANSKLDDSLRAIIVLGYATKRMGLLDSLCGLYSEDITTKELYIDEVWNSIQIAFGPNFAALKSYSNGLDRNITNLNSLLGLAKTIYITSAIKEELRVNETDQPVAYYSSLESFFHMLPENDEDSKNLGKLSIMNISYMNDPNEGKTIQEFIAGRKRIEMHENRKIVSVPYVFLKCFTKQIDYLPMWEMYANHAEGCCIVLDWNKTTAKARIPLYRVCYIKHHGNSNRRSINKTDNALISDYKFVEKNLISLKKIYKKMKNDDARACFDFLLGEVKYLFKDSSYSYEQEMRILKSFPEFDDRIHHTGGDYPKLFVYSDVPVQIKEIVLAPKFDGLSDKIPYLEEQVEKMCKDIGVPLPRITISSIDYR